MNDEQGGGESRVSYSAANASLAMPIITLLLGGVWSANGVGGSKALLGLIAMLLIGAGTVLAIVALCNVNRSGGSVRRAIVALVFNGIFVLFFGLAFIGGFAQGVKARRAERDLMRAAETLRENSRKSFDPERGITNVVTKDAARLREEMEQASTAFKGDDATLAKAWAAYLREIETASGKWQGLYNELRAAKVLDVSELDGKQELRERQALVKRYKASSDAMRELIVGSGDFFRTELKKLGATPGKREEAVRMLQAQLATKAPVLLQIRDLDTRMSDDMLGVLSLMETNWGSWSCPEGRVTFQDQRTLTDYNALIADLRSASQEQLAAQKKLVSLR